MAGPPIFIPFAGTTNYPAGSNPWSSTATKVAPAYTYLTPATSYSAQEYNYLLNQLGIGISNAVAYYGAVNLHPQFQTTVVNTYGACAYDFVTDKWLVAGENSSSHFQTALTSRDIDGSDWAGVMGVTGLSLTSNTNFTGVVRGNEPSVSSKYVYIAAVESSGSSHVIRCDTVADTSSDVLDMASFSDCTGTVLDGISGVIVAGVGASSAAHSGVWATTASGSTWTNPIAPSVAVPQWLLRSNSVFGAGTKLVTVAGVAGGGSNLLSWWTSTNGTSWTAGTVTGLLSSTETPTALAHGTDTSGNSCWLLATWTGTQTNLYRALDATTLTWTSVSNNLGMAGAQIADMQGLGSTYLAVCADSGPCRVLSSVDAGATWSTSPAAVKSASGHYRIGVSSNQFLVVGPISIMPSLAYGASGVVGPA